MKIFTENKHDSFTKKVKIGEEGYLYFDFTKTHMNMKDASKYMDRIKKKNIHSQVEGMFEGKKINYTEDREVLHVALRDKDILKRIKEDEGEKEGFKEKKEGFKEKMMGKFKVKEEDSSSTSKEDQEGKSNHQEGKSNHQERKSNHQERKRNQEIFEELKKMKTFSKSINEGNLKGCSGHSIDTIVNIGIGGSDLGPRFVCEALQEYSNPNLSVHFISNIDASETIKVFKKINPEKTLFIVVSKTFTTLETLKNAELALKYMEESLRRRKREEIIKHHFVAVSSNTEEVRKFGIEHVFTMWDFVGGRYSLWSAVGISISIFLGFENFLGLLEGASVIDEEFKKDEKSVEVLHAIVELFYSDQGYDNKCIVPYDYYMKKFSVYLQQAEMESNGKMPESKDIKNTGMIVWGGVGTNSQHSFFQLLHQGTRNILTEFLLPLTPLHKEEEYHKMIVANCLAQSRALMVGKDSMKREDYFRGSRPSITIAYSKLTPSILGALLAHYEHKIFIQGKYWEINSFDQFGVTLGKTVATEILDDLKNYKKGDEKYDESTNELIKLVMENPQDILK